MKQPRLYRAIIVLALVVTNMAHANQNSGSAPQENDKKKKSLAMRAKLAAQGLGCLSIATASAVGMYFLARDMWEHRAVDYRGIVDALMPDKEGPAYEEAIADAHYKEKKRRWSYLGESALIAIILGANYVFKIPQKSFTFLKSAFTD